MPRCHVPGKDITELEIVLNCRKKRLSPARNATDNYLIRRIEKYKINTATQFKTTLL